MYLYNSDYIHQLKGRRTRDFTAGTLTYTAGQVIIPQDYLLTPQKSEFLSQDYLLIPQNQEILPQECSPIPQKSEIFPQD